VNPMEFRASDFNPMDVATSLSKLCRYNANYPVDRTYSVGQHCILGARMFIAAGRNDLALAFLLHDASEAYFADLPRPVKRNLSEYMEAEERCQSVIAELHGIQYPFVEEIHKMDECLLRAEFYCLYLDAEQQMDTATWILPISHVRETWMKMYKTLTKKEK
jgi:uncharacterized protein